MAEIVTPDELAERLRVSPTTILKWVESRGLPCIRLSQRTIRFDMGEVSGWMERLRDRRPAGTAASVVGA